MPSEEGQPDEKSELAAAQDTGEVAADVASIPVMSYEDGKRFDAEREANQEGWEATAQELNDRRSLGQKILGRGEESPEGVMQDEALRINAQIDKHLKSNLQENTWTEEHAKHTGEPLDEERIMPTTRQGVFEQLKAGESEKMSEGYFREEPLYNPKGKYSKRAATEIIARERKTKPISDKVIEALANGDIKDAEKALAESVGSWRSFDDITMSEHITPELRRIVGKVLADTSKDLLTQLVEAKYLSAYIYPNMAIDAGISPEDLDRNGLKRKVTHLATRAIERYGPHMFETNNSGSRPALEELTRQLDVLSRLGVMSREEIADDWLVRQEAEELAVETTAGDVARYRGDGFSLSSEAWQLVRLGLIDLHQLADSPAMIRVCSMNTAAESKEIVSQATKELRKALLGDEEAPRESEQAA
jgi:hypothetical protein